MFCKSCGTELQGRVGFCPQCGSKIEGTQKIVIPNKKLLAIVAVVILAVIITVVCVNTGGVNSSPEEVAIATIKSEYEVDIDTMMKCFPDFTIREIAVDEGLSVNASRSEVVKEVKENYRYQTPQKVEIIDTDVVKEYAVDKYTIYRELYDYMTDDEYDLITKIAVVNVRFTVDGEQESIQVNCIEMKNKWYFLRDL